MRKLFLPHHDVTALCRTDYYGSSHHKIMESRARPGIVLRKESGNAFLAATDEKLLISELEVKIGENKIKKINFSRDGLQAYVELEDEQGEVVHGERIRGERLSGCTEVCT